MMPSKSVLGLFYSVLPIQFTILFSLFSFAILCSRIYFPLSVKCASVQHLPGGFGQVISLACLSNKS